MVLVGDVRGKTAILVDDMADTCGTLVKAAEVLISEGAKDALAIVTHGILSGNAIEALNGSKLKRIVVTNTVYVTSVYELLERHILTSHQC
jgi:ribose-phosphate pyrophosphokinase